MCSLLTSLVALALAFPSTAQSAVVNRKLSGPMVTGAVDDVDDLLISPSGVRVLFTVSRGEDTDSDESLDWPTHLVVAPTDGSAPAIPLSPVDEPDILRMLWTADETRVVFVGERRVGPLDFRRELFSALADGSGATLLFSRESEEGLFPDFASTVQLTSDGSRVLYLLSTDGVTELYSVPVGGGVSVRLNDPLPLDADVLRFVVSGATVVYVAEEVNEFDELYAVPADGSAAPINLTHVATSADGVRAHVVDPTGTRVVYQSHHPSRQLRSVPLDGSAPPAPLSPILPSEQVVESFRVSPDGARVVYWAEQTANFHRELFVVPIDGSAPAAPLVTTAADVDVVGDYSFSPDGEYVVYKVTGPINDNGLYSVRPADGTISELFPVQTHVYSLRVSPDSSRVVFSVGDEERELYSVPIDGSSPAVRINPDFVPGGIVKAFEVSADSLHVFYLADAEVDGVEELYRVAIEPSGVPVATQLSAPLVSGGDVDLFRLTPDPTRVLYLADERTDEVRELFRAPDDTVLSDPLFSAVVGDVSAMEARNGRVVYLADQEIAGQIELFGAPSDGSAPPVLLSETMVSGGDVLSVALSPDGSTAVYRADAEVYGRIELFSVPADGSAPPVKLNTALTGSVGSFGISPDGARVVYIADQTSSPGMRLHAVPIQGGASIALGSAPQSSQFTFTPDSEHVVFVRAGLRSVPIDGSAVPVLLSSFGSTFVYTATPDGQRIVFLAGPQGRLYSNSVHGGALLDLSGELVAGGHVERFELSADGTRAVYLADRLIDDRFLLSSVPVDGGMGSLVLNGPMVGGGDVHAFSVSPTGLDVLYVADQLNNRVDKLHRVPLDGSAPDVVLSNWTTHLDATSLRVTPDGAHVVVSNFSGALLSLPVAGGTWHTVTVDYDGAFAFAGDGRRVVYLDAQRVWMAPIGSGLPVPLSPDAPSVALSFVLDGPRVVYRADEESVVELYSSGLQPTEHTPLVPGRPIRR